jgi:hypothetical protein
VIVSTMNRKNVSPPMHHVYESRIPERRTLTGCRCRKKFERTASVRLRGVSG